MPIPANAVLSVEKRLRRLGAPCPPGFWDRDPREIAALCNWIGSDDPSAKWASLPLNTVLPWMKPASVPHDGWWSPWYNDGSRKLFKQSNDEFRDTLDLLAKDSFGWVWPGFLRRKLRDARQVEADVAHFVLMSGPCFRIWEANARASDKLLP